MNPMRRVLVSLLAMALLGCGRQPEGRHIVVMVDVSGSIEPQAEGEVFKAIDDLVSHLKRGDKITVIPILGDAEAEASGRIIRFEVPFNRQAYDSDLRHFAAKLKKSLEELKSSAMEHPGTKTDILGSISLAEQEIRSNSGTPKSILVILSDFIQDDSEINFLKDGRLNNSSTAKEFSRQLGRRERLNFGGIPVYLGLLKSKEYAGCSRSRRSAIQEFWIGYFTSFNSAPEFASDGLGLLKKIISAK
jgi:hypothetical protein